MNLDKLLKREGKAMEGFIKKSYIGYISGIESNISLFSKLPNKANRYKREISNPISDIESMMQDFNNYKVKIEVEFKIKEMK